MHILCLGLLFHAISQSITSVCRNIVAVYTLLWQYVRWCTQVPSYLHIMRFFPPAGRHFTKPLMYIRNVVGDMTYPRGVVLTPWRSKTFLFCSPSSLNLVLLLYKYDCIPLNTLLSTPHRICFTARPFLTL